MPYPQGGYRGGGALRTQPNTLPATPRPMPRPYGLPPRPANDPIRTPRPANDNVRPVSFTRWVRRVSWVRTAWQVTQLWLKYNKVTPPDMTGYYIHLNCGSGGGKMTYGQGFYDCSPAVMFPGNTDGDLNGTVRPSNIFEWGPFFAEHSNPDADYYSPGRWWKDSDPWSPIKPNYQIVSRTLKYELNDRREWWYPFTRPLPWRFIPSRPPTGLPEDSEFGPLPPPRPVPVTDNPGGTSWTFNDNRPSSPPRPLSPSLPRPPGPNEREAKVYVTLSGTTPRAARLLGIATETADLIEALYEALPLSLRLALERAYARRAFREGRWTTPPPQQQLYWVWKYWAQIDMGQAFVNIGLNEVEDRAIGFAARRGARVSGQAGGLVGLTFGPGI